MGLARLAALGCAIRQWRARHYVELMHDAHSTEGDKIGPDCRGNDRPNQPHSPWSRVRVKCLNPALFGACFGPVSRLFLAFFGHAGAVEPPLDEGQTAEI
jgi:hypothetical protein